MQSYHKCCRITTIQRRALLVDAYSGIARARKTTAPTTVGPTTVSPKLTAAPVNLNVQIANLLPQRVAVQTEQIGGSDLIAPRRRQCRRQQRHLYFLENPVVE